VNKENKNIKEGEGHHVLRINSEEMKREENPEQIFNHMEWYTQSLGSS
jgi:hypothetical protein